MKRRAGLAATAIALGMAAAVTATAQSNDGTGAAVADDKGAVVNKLGTPKKFNHDQHRKLDKPPVTDDNCNSCHGSDKRGNLSKPAESGHQPCLSSGCHAADFLAVGDNTRKSDLARYRKAADFCLGCHQSDSGDAPPNFKKAAADNIYKNNADPDHHIEMDHFDHISKQLPSDKKIGCRDCHVVDPSSNRLQLGSPGHAQCANCHGTSAPAMTKCESCHSQPGKKVYLAKKRKGSEVRSCGSPSHLRLAKRRNKLPNEVPCFRHETKDHRFRGDGRRLECGSCHYMFASKKYWSKRKRYGNLQEIAAAPMIDNARDKAHKQCGQSGACHASDVRLGSSGRSCKLCHDQKTIDTGLFD